MSFEIIYNEFYSAVYDKAEHLIKKYFIAQRQDHRKFGSIINNVRDYLSGDLLKKYGFDENPELKKLYEIFKKRSNYYMDQHATKLILENELKMQFDAISIVHLSKTFDYSKFIKRIAISEVASEVLRLLDNQSQFLSLFYELNEFDEFVIRQHKGYIEDNPIYQKLYRKMNGIDITDLRHNLPLYDIIPTGILSSLLANGGVQKENADLLELSNYPIKTTDDDSILSSDTTISTEKYNRNYWNEQCYRLFLYLVENYENETKTKYTNIYYFLKDHVQSNKVMFHFEIDPYKKFIAAEYNCHLKNFKKSQFKFIGKEVPILSELAYNFLKQS